MIVTREERIEKVRRFQDACRKAGFKEVASNVYELQGPFSKTLTLCTLIHGNEIGGIEVFLKLLEEIQAKKVFVKSRLRLMLGNLEAYFEDKRFLETDMNRSFGLDSHQTKEERRAQELETYLRDSDVLIDVHQTIGPTTTPFYIFESDERSYNLARFLHPTLPVITCTMDRSFKGKTSTAYMISRGRMGITIETGQKGIEDTQISLGLELARKAVEIDFEKAIPAQAPSNTFTFSQIINNPDGSLELIESYDNFDEVKKGEVLARNSEKEVSSMLDGVILFPKYGAHAKKSAELALILKRLN